MFQSVNFSDFVDSFRKAGRENQFSYEGLRVLFDYLESYEQNTEEQIELDVIALCCDYCEAHYTDIQHSHNIDLSDVDDDDDQCRAVGEYLQENTTLIGEVCGGFVYVQF